MKKLTNLLTFTALFATSLLTYSAEEDKRSFSVTEVAPGIHMIAGVGGFTGGNIGLSVGEDGVVMIDDSMPPLLDRMKKAIRTVTDKPVDFLINTHVHGDHTGNNQNMGKDGTHIVAHENLRLNMLRGRKTKDGVKPTPKAALPVITFSHSMSFHLNGEDANIIHLAKAHTDGDAIIHYKKANVIHTGDIFFNGMFPYIDINNGGSVNGFIAALQEILKLSDGKTKIIPGHGPLGSVKELKQELDMLIDAKKLVLAQIQLEKTEDEVVEINPLASYDKKWTWDFITTEKMTRQVYKSLKK